MQVWIKRALSYGWRALVVAVAFAVVWTITLLTTNPVPGVGLPDNSIEPLGNRATFASPKGLVLERHTSPLRHFIVTYVHGISCHSADYSAPFQFRLAKAMGFVPMDPTGKATDRGKVNWFELDGKKIARNGSETDYLQISDAGSLSPDITAVQIRAHFDKLKLSRKIPDRFADLCLSTETKGGSTPRKPPAQIHNRKFINPRTKERLTFVEVLWSPLSEAHKRSQLGFDMTALSGAISKQGQAGDQSTNSGPAPASLNNSLKQTIINGAISDAIYYLGDGGKAVREAVFAGLSMSFNIAESSNKHAGLVPKHILITESLGSRIAFDALREAPDNNIDRFSSIGEFIRSDPLVIFFANQLPLMETAKVERPSLDSSANQVSKQEIERVNFAISETRRLYDDPFLNSILKDKMPYFSFCNQKFPNYQRLIAIKRSDDRDLLTLQNGESIIFYSPFFAYAALKKFNGFTYKNGKIYGPNGAANPFVKDYDKTISYVEIIYSFLAGQKGGGGYRNCRLFINELDAIILKHQTESNARYFAKDEKIRLSLPKPAMSDSDFQRVVHLRHIAQTLLDFTVYEIDPLSNLVSLLQTSRIYELLKEHRSICSKYTEKSYAYGCSIDSVLMKIAVTASNDFIKAYVYSDPNDLLTYRVKSDETRAARGTAFQFINVPVRLAAPILPFSGASGVFAQPMDAHLLHKYDNKVLEYIVCGWAPEKASPSFFQEFYPGTCEARPGNRRAIVAR